jgi:hypothetical protein
MGALQTYDIVCELYEGNSDIFNTGIAEIDTVYNALSLAEDTYFTPWKSEFVVEASRKLTVEVKSQDAELIMENAPKIQVSGIKEKNIDPITEHVIKLVRMLLKEDINVKNLTIKKDKVNNIVATYLQENKIEQTQVQEIIDGIISKLPK